jgi:hypothetical protein
MGTKLNKLRRFVDMTAKAKDEVYAEIMANITILAGCGCWLWNSRRDSHGYAIKWIAGREFTVSRFMLAFHTRESLNFGKDACHRAQCLYKACVRPDHLEWDTHGENMATRKKMRILKDWYPGKHHAKKTVKVPGGVAQYLQPETRLTYKTV